MNECNGSTVVTVDGACSSNIGVPSNIYIIAFFFFSELTCLFEISLSLSTVFLICEILAFVLRSNYCRIEA